MASRRMLACLASIQTAGSCHGAEDNGHRPRGPRWLIACPRFPLPPNGCAATVSAADVAFLASKSNCGEVRWTRSLHAEPADRQDRGVLAAALHRYLDINPIGGRRW